MRATLDRVVFFKMDRAIVWPLCAAGVWLTAIVFAASCGQTASAREAQTAASRSREDVRQDAAALTTLGRRIFVDASLSGSGRISCASCHDPARAFGPNNALPVQRGGKDLSAFGTRAAPSLLYLQVVPQFTEHFFDSEDEGDSSVDNGPTGGLTWDGRVDLARDQARIPLFSPFEMANANVAGLAAKARRAPYAGAIRDIVGAAAFNNDDAIVETIGRAVEAYQQVAADFYPYNSKYDAYLAGNAQLTESEGRGLAVFNDAKKGNCASCHISERGKNGTPPQFTDYGFAAIGVPRNAAIPANADRNYFDLGLCGPVRTDLHDKPEYCGLFITPTLRNITLRQSFFHNGVVHTLRDAVRFYAERDTAPEKWYPRDLIGLTARFNDLPPKYWTNVEMRAPFGGHPGQRPLLSDTDIDDIVAFLWTLTDGFVPSPLSLRRQEHPVY